MDYTDEQKKILQDGFSDTDITQISKLKNYSSLSPSAAKLMKLTRRYMLRDLNELGIKRNLGNYSPDHPVNLLINADSGVIAEQAAQIMSSESETAAAVDYFFETFSPHFEYAMKSYCEAKDKSEDQLSDEDIEIIATRVIQVVNEELLSAVMVGQKAPELFKLSSELPAHEDYLRNNNDSINFYNRWYHIKTEVGKMLSISGENDEFRFALDYAEMNDYYALRDSFSSMLDDTDKRIFELREKGYTQAEIASELGFKNHSAVTKRLDAMKKKFEKMIKE